MSIAVAGGGEDGNAGGDHDSSNYKVNNTNAAPDPKKMGTLGIGMLCYLQGRTADAIARGEEPPWGGLYAPPADLCVANPPTTKATKKAKPSASYCKDD
jgi:hypothetical protein